MKIGGIGMAEDAQEPRDGLSRRRALKRIGAAAGIAWTVPIISSLNTPAFAGSPVHGCTEDFACGGPFTVCGTGIDPNRPECFCDRDASGAAVCLDRFCTQTCATNSDC